MKIRSLLRHSLAGLLSLAAVLTLSVWPAPTSVMADETDFDTSDTAFTNPQWDTGVMYFWHEGLPQKDDVYDSNGNVLKYPLLITWDDCYYFCCDDPFKSKLSDSYGSRKEKWGWYVGVPSSYDMLFHVLEYDQYYGYEMSSAALLSKAGFDVDTLFTLGEAVSMQTPMVPSLVTTDPGNDHYALAVPESVYGKDRWLVASLRTN